VLLPTYPLPDFGKPCTGRSLDRSEVVVYNSSEENTLQLW
jgi:hypothetical protein